MAIIHFLLWLPMILIAFANAMLREFFFIKHFTELRSHQLSTITLIILCIIYVWFVFPLMKIQTAQQCFMVGIAWVLLTVGFEFTLGRLTNKSWDYMLRDYNLIAGKIWLIFLICLFLLPYIVFVIRNK